jgi:katanin p60 ATPase-containing subunit A1
MMRRLEKRILVPLPSAEARLRIFTSLMAGRCSPDVRWQDVASKTEGYSGELRTTRAYLVCLHTAPS